MFTHMQRSLRHMWAILRIHTETVLNSKGEMWMEHFLHVERYIWISAAVCETFFEDCRSCTEKNEVPGRQIFKCKHHTLLCSTCSEIHFIDHFLTVGTKNEHQSILINKQQLNVSGQRLSFPLTLQNECSISIRMFWLAQSRFTSVHSKLVQAHTANFPVCVHTPEFRQIYW